MASRTSPLIDTTNFRLCRRSKTPSGELVAEVRDDDRPCDGVGFGDEAERDRLGSSRYGGGQTLNRHSITLNRRKVERERERELKKNYKFLR